MANDANDRAENPVIEGFSNHISETYLYPWFPYWTDDQPIMDGPPYQVLAERLAELCLEHKLIADAACKSEGRNLKVWYITFLDGNQMRLSDMQAMLVLQGVLKGYKRLKEVELGLRPLYEQVTKVVRLPERDAPIRPYIEGEIKSVPTRSRSPQPRKKADPVVPLPTEAAKAVEEMQNKLADLKKDDSWMDGFFD